jgi:RimJ/RimL family protein N-acetyltransferase
MNLVTRAARRLNTLMGVDREETLFFEALSGCHPPSLALASGVQLGTLDRSGIADFCRISSTHPALVEERWRAGDVCYLAYLEDRIVHHSWVKSRDVQPVMEADLRLPVKAGEFWIYHCWTAEAARGKRIYPCVLAAILQEYFALGFTCGRIYTSRKNLASQRGIQTAGFHYTSSQYALRVGSRWHRLSAVNRILRGWPRAGSPAKIP